MFTREELQASSTLWRDDAIHIYLRDMLRITTAIILALLVLLALFKAPILVFSLIVGIVAVLATYEYLSLVKAHELQPMWILTMLAIAFSIVTTYLNIRFRSM